MRKSICGAAIIVSLAFSATNADETRYKTTRSKGKITKLVNGASCAYDLIATIYERCSVYCARYEAAPGCFDPACSSQSTQICLSYQTSCREFENGVTETLINCVTPDLLQSDRAY